MALIARTYSRLRDTVTLTQEGEEVWGTWVMPSFLTGLSSSQQISIRVGNDVEGRPDLISLDLYGTTELDWVLIAFNNANAVLNWPRTGDVIRAPISEVVLGEVI